MSKATNDWVKEQIQVCESAIDGQLAAGDRDRSQLVVKLSRQMKTVAKARFSKPIGSLRDLGRRLVALAGPAGLTKMIGTLGDGAIREPRGQMLYDVGALLGGVEPPVFA